MNDSARAPYRRSGPKKSFFPAKEHVSGAASLKPGVLLDLAPPFTFLEAEEYSNFRALARACGVEEVQLDAATRNSFFFEANAKVRSYFIASCAALKKADGALDAYISAGFVEEKIPAHLKHPQMLDAIQNACGLTRARIGEETALVIPSAEPLRKHLDNVLATHLSRFLDSGAPVERLLKGIAAGARTIVPNGDSSTHRMTLPVSPLARPRTLEADEVKALGLKDKMASVQAVLVFGLDRRGRRDPIAFLPIELGGRKDVFHLKLPDRPLAFLLPSRRLADNSERSDLETHVIDLDLPAITPWEIAYATALGHIGDAINRALGREFSSLAEITLVDEDRHKALLCWIETPRKRSVPSSSLDRLDRIALMPAPVGALPGLAPLAAHAAGTPPPTPPALDPGLRLTHADPRFPLDPYQARAANAISSLAGDWAQSVTGPPGTGKTSMMRDVISDRIGESLKSDDAPCLLLAGPTIQAYENLLGAVSFSWEGAPPGCERIFPDFPHIGAVIPTGTALAEAGPSRPVPHLRFYSARAEITHHEGFATVELPEEVGKIVTDHQTAGMIELLMARGRDLPLSEPEAKREIDATCTRLDIARDWMRLLHQIAREGTRASLMSLVWPEEIRALKADFNDRLAVAPGRDLSEQIDAALDLTLRFDTFHRVFRMAQIRFVVAAYALRREQSRLRVTEWVRKTDRDALQQSFKDAIACLLPIRTATVTSLGKKAVEQFGRPADLVIVDEAGMMEPEYVPAMMAEGRRTLAVGDPYQIPPVGTELLPIHGALLLRAGVPEEQVALWSRPELPRVAREPAHKAGNGLSILEAMSAFRGTDALVLQRHYRCPESIIEISNDLIYRARKIPLEAVKKDPPPNPDRLPVIATVLHDGTPVNGRNYNPGEAEAIVTAFLMYHRTILAEARGAPAPEQITLDAHLELMPDAVAFISPYRNQTKLEVPRSAQDRETVAGYADHLPKGAQAPFLGFLANLMLAQLNKLLPGQEERVRKVIEKTVFGTIHALQGAERPVVFLSCVADENTSFFNKDPSLINVGVTRAQSHLVIARSTAFAAGDAPGTAARSIVETITRSQVILPERLMVVESRDKARPIERALPHVLKIIATRGTIGKVSGLDATGNPIVEIAPSSLYTAEKLAEARRWITPTDEGGFGLKTLILGTDADDAGETIAHDVMRYLGLDRTEIARRGLTVTRWPMEDPAALADMLSEEIKAARDFRVEITGRWRADRQRARAELRTALSRGIRARLRQESPGIEHPSLGVLRTMRWLEERENSGWEVRAQLADDTGRRFEAPLCLSPGTIRTFPDEEEAQACAKRLEAVPRLSNTELAMPSPIRTRRSLYDVLSVLAWGGVAPLKAMKVLQRFFEKSNAP